MTTRSPGDTAGLGLVVTAISAATAPDGVAGEDAFWAWLTAGAGRCAPEITDSVSVRGSAPNLESALVRLTASREPEEEVAVHASLGAIALRLVVSGGAAARRRGVPSLAGIRGHASCPLVGPVADAASSTDTIDAAARTVRRALAPALLKAAELGCVFVAAERPHDPEFATMVVERALGRFAGSITTFRVPSYERGAGVAAAVASTIAVACASRPDTAMMRGPALAVCLSETSVTALAFGAAI